MRLTIDTTTDDAQAARDAIDFLTQRYGLDAVKQPEPFPYAASEAMSKLPVEAFAGTQVPKIPPAQSPTFPHTPGAVERDSAGVPYDERIHSGGRSKSKDGKWQRRRGVDDAQYVAVLAELMGASAAAVPAIPPLPVATAPAPVIPPLPIAQPTPAAAPALTWQQVCGVLNEKVMGGKVNPDQLNAKAAELGVEPFALIGQRPDLYPVIHAWLSAL